MNVLPQARDLIAKETAAFERDRLRYQPELRPFVDQHGLAELVETAWRLMCQHGEVELGRPAGYPFFHGMRVARAALWLADSPELEHEDLDRVALFAAALFHDVSHVERDDNHRVTGARIVRDELAGFLPQAQLDLAAELVLHSDNANATLDRTESRILYDANTLDLHGAIYWWRAAAFSGAQALPMGPALVALAATMATHREWAEKVHFQSTRDALRSKSSEEELHLAALAAELGVSALLGQVPSD